MQQKTKIFILALILGLFCASLYAVTSVEPETSAQRVTRIYEELVKKSGLQRIIPPIVVLNMPIANAYNTSDLIVIYQGIIDMTDNDDELALIIGHEMAHSTLMHFGLNPSEDSTVQQILESQADRMGAFYIMRSGYDICKAREIWEKFNSEYGDTLGADHPPVSYRYDQLNVGCEDGGLGMPNLLPL